MARRCGFGFGRGGTSEARDTSEPVFPSARACLHDHVNGAAVFRVHADHGRRFFAVVRMALKMLASSSMKHAGIRHEEFEAGDAFAHQLRSFLRAARRAGP